MQHYQQIGERIPLGREVALNYRFEHEALIHTAMFQRGFFLKTCGQDLTELVQMKFKNYKFGPLTSKGHRSALKDYFDAYADYMFTSDKDAGF